VWSDARRLAPVVALVVALMVSGRALAQSALEAADPDVEVPTAPAPKPSPTPAPTATGDKLPQLNPAYAPKGAPTPAPSVAPASPSPVTSKSPAPSKTPLAPTAAPVPPSPAVAEIPVITATKVTDEDFDVAWRRWRAAAQSKDVGAEQSARAALVRLKTETASPSFETWAMALLRVAAQAQAEGDAGAAIEMALTATELAPELPAAWAGLAQAYFRADPTELGRVVGALWHTTRLQLQDVRYRRALVGDLATMVVFALIALAAGFTLVLLLRRGRYFLYDFHFLFPRAAARWQTMALGILLLLAPVVFRAGVVWVLLAGFAAVTLYVERLERLVCAVLIGVLGLLPPLAEVLASRTAFVDTPAERLLALDQGGPGSQSAALATRALASSAQASPAELAALGTWELRRGELDLAATHLKAAVASRPADMSTATNLGLALFLGGDLENSKDLLAKASEQGVAEAAYALGRVYQRRVALAGAAGAGQVDKANAAFGRAAQLAPDRFPVPTVELSTKAPNPAWRVLAAARVAQSDIPMMAGGAVDGQPLRSQLNQTFLGPVHPMLALVLPAILAALVAAAGGLASRLKVSKVCNKCGQPVSVRGDPDLSLGSLMCSQCVNVFTRKAAVVPALKVRKQLEIARYRTRLERVAYGLGLTFAGMGHVFTGFPVRGAVYGLVFASAVVGVVWRNGALRAPYDGLPLVPRMVPLLIALAVVYFFALRGLRKRQG
jgi:tetratricopeptide (TPR) repeat protein